MSEQKNKTEGELRKLLLEKRESLRNFRLSLSGGKSRNVREGRNLRKEIARLMTDLSSGKSALNNK